MNDTDLGTDGSGGPSEIERQNVNFSKPQTGGLLQLFFLLQYYGLSSFCFFHAS